MEADKYIKQHLFSGSMKTRADTAPEARIMFRDLQFHEGGEENRNAVKVTLMDYFHFTIPKEELDSIGPWRIDEESNSRTSLAFTGVAQEKAQRKIQFLIAKYIPELKSFLNHPATYVHASSGIPLMGTLFFGIVDKGTDMIEVKPLAGCTMNCMFCSVDEGPFSKKGHDFIVECEYLADELEKILEYKKHKGMQVYLNPHGEPLLYPRIGILVDKIKNIPWVEKVIVITSGFHLTPKLIDELAHPKVQLNISLCAIDPEKAKKIAGIPAYNLNRLLDSIKYAAKKMDVMITPVIMQGINDDQMEPLIQFSKEAGCTAIKMQNFLVNKRGRNPVKELPWSSFEQQLRALEQKHGISLFFEMRKLPETKELPRPFKKGQAVFANIAGKGRYKNEYVAVAENRSILVRSANMLDIGKTVKVKIQRSKHNIFIGEANC